MLPARESQIETTQHAPSHENDRGQQEAIDDRRLGGDRAELVSDGDPGGAPDRHRRNIEEAVAHRAVTEPRIKRAIPPQRVQIWPVSRARSTIAPMSGAPQ